MWDDEVIARARRAWLREEILEMPPPRAAWRAGAPAAISSYALDWAVRGRVRYEIREQAAAERAGTKARRQRAGWWMDQLAEGRVREADLDAEVAIIVRCERRRLAGVRRRVSEDPEGERQKRERAAEFAERRRDLDRMVRKRIVEGLVGGFVEVGGRWRGLVREHGLRSTDSVNIRLFVARTAKKPMCGMTKDRVVRADSALLGRDEPYIAYNHKFWAMLRVDLDRIFRSWDELRRLLESTGLPLPHLAVADVDPATGEVVRPHLIWHLPVGSEVWNEPLDQRCRTAPRRLFQAAHRGLTEKLLHLGADQGALANPHHGKSASSPYWHVVDRWNESIYWDLSQFASAVDASGERLLDMSVTPEALARRASMLAARDGSTPDRVSDRRSNELFQSMRASAWEILRAWRAAADPRYVRGLTDRAALAADLQGALEDSVRGTDADAKQAVHVARAVARHVAPRWSEAKADAGREKVARGRDAHLHDLGTSLYARQAESARATARGVSATNREDVLKAYEKAAKAEKRPTYAAVGRDLGIDPRTVRDHLKAAAAEAAASGLGTVTEAPQGVDAGVRVDFAETASASGFLSIHRIVGPLAAVAEAVGGDVDSGASGPIRTVETGLPDPPDPPCDPPTPPLPSSSDYAAAEAARQKAIAEKALADAATVKAALDAESKRADADADEIARLEAAIAKAPHTRKCPPVLLDTIRGLGR